jgi:uncharacterized coiled-coil protein SlyX
MADSEELAFLKAMRASLEVRMDKLEAKLEARMDKLEARMLGVEVAVSGLSRIVINLVGTLEQLDLRVKRVEATQS